MPAAACERRGAADDDVCLLDLVEPGLSLLHHAVPQDEVACSRPRSAADRYPLSLHDALPIWEREALIGGPSGAPAIIGRPEVHAKADRRRPARSPGLRPGVGDTERGRAHV